MVRYPGYSLNKKLWDMREPGADPVCSVPVLREFLLKHRGLVAEELREACLAGLHDPYELLGMEKAVTRVLEALERKEKIALLGDYDVDGITGTTILMETLRELGAEDVLPLVPDRFREGYGLNLHHARRCLDESRTLILTIDNGTSAVEPITHLQFHGVDVVVLDHHLPMGEKLPPAFCIVNPNQPGCSSRNKDLCGAGVAWKLCEALTSRAHAARTLDLAAVATIADMMNLRGENRILTQLGLDRLRHDPHPVLAVLCEMARIDRESISAQTVAFSIAPRINTGHRIPCGEGEENPATTLFFRREGACVRDLERLLKERQRLQHMALAEVERTLREQREQCALVLLARKPGPIGEGIAGLAASALLERSGKPSIVFVHASDGLLKGSARSAENFNIAEALRGLKQHFITVGGHKHAAGCALRSENLPTVQEGLCLAAAGTLRLQDLHPRIRIDAEIEPRLLSVRPEHLEKMLKELGPFGTGNEIPHLLLRSINFTRIRTQGALGEHLAGTAIIGRDPRELQGFGLGHLAPTLSSNKRYDIVFSLDAKASNRPGAALTPILRDLREDW